MVKEEEGAIMWAFWAEFLLLGPMDWWGNCSWLMGTGSSFWGVRFSIDDELAAFC